MNITSLRKRLHVISLVMDDAFEQKNLFWMKEILASASISIRGLVEHMKSRPEEFDGGGCSFAGPGRGDCEHFVGLPGKSIPGQHDGPDDTIDAYGKPNGWCWSCWKSKQIADLREELRKCKDEIS